MVSRSEGYAAGAWKEKRNLECAEQFFVDVLGYRPTRITDPDQNYQLGDFRFPAATLECKGQGIDPEKYPQNFIEVCEVTNSAKHARGCESLCRILALGPQELAGVPIQDRRKVPAHELQRQFGSPPSVSVSIANFSAASHVMYVNAEEGGRHVYIYKGAHLLELIRRAVRASGMQRGAGRSNEDTFSVRVALPPLRWRRPHAAWSYSGTGDAASSVAELKMALGIA